MKQLNNKKVLYLSFNPSPSELVRGKIFYEGYVKSGYNVTFYSTYSKLFKPFVDFAESIPSIPLFKFLAYKTQGLIGKIKQELILQKIDKYDAIVIIKYIKVDFLKKIKRKSKASILYDFDDAVWLDCFFGEKTFKQIAELSDFISCDNSFLADYTRKINKNVFILNGPPQVELFAKKEERNKRGVDTNNKISIGWVGSPSTVFYLNSIFNALETVGKEFSNLEFVILGGGFDNKNIPAFKNVICRVIPAYDQKMMIDVVSEFDIGLFPLLNDAMSLGRGSLKAMVYMSAEVAVIAAGFGENRTLIKDRENGLLAVTEDEWINAIKLLVQDSDLRKKIAYNGRCLMLEQYNIMSCFKQLEINFLSNTYNKH